MVEAGVLASPPRWSRRGRRLIGISVAAIVLVAIVVIVVELSIAYTTPINLAQAGFGSGEVASCYALQFYLDRPGVLSAAWYSNPGSSAFLLASSQFHGGGTNCVVGMWGTALWSGRTNVSSDSLRMHLASGTYFLAFVAPPGGCNVLGTTLVLNPDPWWAAL